MWNLNGDDIQRAKEEMKGRRAAIQARYEAELKQLEADIADLETFERFAVKFHSDFKSAEAAPPAAADPPPAAESVVDEIVAQVTGEASNPAAEGPAAASPAPEPAASAEPASGQRSSSRWRMRLNTGEAAP